MMDDCPWAMLANGPACTKAAELARALETAVRDRLIREIKAVGYGHVTIDLQGYRMGSLNEGLRLRPVQ